MTRCFGFLALVFALAFAPSAQDIPAVGTTATLDVATWNIERFGDSGGGPSNDVLQRQNVAAVIGQAEIDLWALQELNDETDFDLLLDDLGDGWAGVRVDPEFGSIGYGYIYRTDVIQQLQIGTVLTDFSFEFASRPPLQLRANVTLPDTTLEIRFLDLHMKAGGTQEDWQRRTDASAALKNYVDNLQAVGVHVVILGDLNDELIVSISSGRTSPYQNFLDDASYLFATRDFDQPGSSEDRNTFCSSSTCSSGSVLDHIIATANLADDYVEDSTQRFAQLLTLISGYTNTTSDHLPVYASFDFEGTGTANEPEGALAGFSLETPSPNPFTDQATFTFSLAEPGAFRLELFDALGRRVSVLADEQRAAGRYRIRLNGDRLTPGFYLVRLTAGERTVTRRFVRAR